MKPDKPQFLQLRRKVKPSSHLGQVLKYLSQSQRSLNDEVSSLLVARFLPLAMSNEGKINRSIAIDCLATLKGYIYAIEQSLGIEPTAFTPSPTLNPSPPKFEEEEEDWEDEVGDRSKEDDDLKEVQSKLEFTERMFGIENN